MENESQKKLSIGVPIFNGEKFFKRCMDSLLNQTFQNFEIIISDNASTDSTPKLCQELMQKDKRIKYFRQKENIGPHNNYFFLLNHAKYEYFAWAAIDDFLDSNFFKKNIEILEKNQNVVSSMGKTKPFQNENEESTSKSETSQYPKFISNYVKKGRWRKISVTYPVSGNYDKKIRTFLKDTGGMSRFYGVYRTSQLRKCIVGKPFICVEECIFLNLLKYGDLYELDDVCLYKYDEGFSTHGIIKVAKNTGHGFIGTLFPFLPFTKWCFHNLDFNIFLKNMDIFIRMNLGGIFALGVDIVLQIWKKLKN